MARLSSFPRDERLGAGFWSRCLLIIFKRRTKGIWWKRFFFSLDILIDILICMAVAIVKLEGGGEEGEMDMRKVGSTLVMIYPIRSRRDVYFQSMVPFHALGMLVLAVQLCRNRIGQKFYRSLSVTFLTTIWVMLNVCIPMTLSIRLACFAQGNYRSCKRLLLHVLYFSTQAIEIHFKGRYPWGWIQKAKADTGLAGLGRQL
ncbi:hypothetical protein K504DRAFT_161697 [Pleomassaria siparia CBS 279.74]|uniref:Uncharacterized protein n=1 Tax=Pleomassaria siparia CBS 279.74 TaxID=1314801 RepID=A0A6G1JVL7_9PLEO|nr:hypothetical protein K504DRAFT_161697 [Pleomassaria siparia CBS 279.74]